MTLQIEVTDGGFRWTASKATTNLNGKESRTMRLQHFEQLQPICLNCFLTRSQTPRLELSVVTQGDDSNIVHGILRCSSRECQFEYPIIDGIPFLVPNLRQFIADHSAAILSRTDLDPVIESVVGDCCGTDSHFNVSRQHLSSYGWCHYGDLDPEQNDSSAGSTAAVFRSIQQRVPLVGSGPQIDLGCSVGRTSFELARATGQLTIGVDLNLAMLRIASRVLSEGQAVFPYRRGGMVYDVRKFPVNFPQHELVDFWACDATCLPFTEDSFGYAISLNTLDSVASPVGLLQSIGRVLKPGAAADIACPYDWSSSVTPVEGWIGGHSQRAEHCGFSDKVLKQILSPPCPLAESLQIAAEQDGIDWIVRIHDRSKMSYRLHFLRLTIRS